MKHSHSYIAIPPGETIREQLEYLGMSQKEFAVRMGMDEQPNHCSKARSCTWFSSCIQEQPGGELPDEARQGQRRECPHMKTPQPLPLNYQRKGWGVVLEP